jgi:hypothetical protein
VKHIEETDIIERTLSGSERRRAEKTSAKTSAQNAKVRMRFKPYEIKTMRIEVSSPVL